MRRITTGKLAKVLCKRNPIITDDMVRAWVEDGRLRAFRNPGSDQGWYYADPDDLPRFLMEELKLPPEEYSEAVIALGLNVTQLNLMEGT